MKHLPLLAGAVLAPVLLAAQAPRTESGSPVVVPAPATTLPLKHAPEPTTSAITARDLMTRLYIFADDSMQGREAGTAGNVKGTDYIAREVRRLGLQPAGDNGTYFQTIPFKTRAVDPASTLSVGGQALAYGTDWTTTGSGPVARDNVPVVYGGALGGDTAALIKPDQVAGKLVVFTTAPGAGFRALRGAGRAAPGAQAVIVIGGERLGNQFGGNPRRPATFLDDPAAVGRGGNTPVITVTRSAAAKMFDTPLDQLTTGAAGKTASIGLIVHIDPVPFPARNVVAILPGSDPKLKGEYVAIGAHNDHVGFAQRAVDHDSIRIYNHLVRPGGAENARDTANAEQQAEVNRQLAAWRAAHPGTQRLDSISNGADDDGSGSVSVLEIAEKMASLKGGARPKRSILFVWHVGEEKGLLGSAYFTEHPTVPRDSIVAQLNIDMDGRGDNWDVTGLTKDGQVLHGNPNYVQLVGSRRLSSELGNLIEQVNTADKHNFVFDYSMDANGHPMNIYCRSDHYEYARWGIPITFFTTGGHSDYHQVTDEPEYIDYDHMARVTTLVEDIAEHVANLDHRVAVDQPKPDPHGACRQ